MKVILASGSPRRKELLQMITDNFEIVISECEEIITKEQPDEVTCELAMQKAEAVAKQVDFEDFLVIGADTVVSIHNKILGKPANTDEARNMIHLLQGKEHQVYTGVALIYRKRAYAGREIFLFARM